MTFLAYECERITVKTPQLLPALEKLYRNFAAHEGHTNPVAQFMDAITARLDDETMLVILALVDNEAVGYGLAYDVVNHPFIPTWERAGYITQLFVLERHQRQGIGRALVAELMTWFAERGVNQVMLNVDVGNETGTRFWQQAGFTPYLLRMKRAL